LEDLVKDEFLIYDMNYLAAVWACPLCYELFGSPGESLPFTVRSYLTHRVGPSPSFQPAVFACTLPKESLPLFVKVTLFTIACASCLASCFSRPSCNAYTDCKYRSSQPAGHGKNNWI